MEETEITPPGVCANFVPERRPQVEMASQEEVDKEIGMLLVEMERLGTKGEDGKVKCKFGALIKDDRCSNIFEAIVGTLRAAKKQKKIHFEGQMLLSPAHDDVDVVIL